MKAAWDRGWDSNWDIGGPMRVATRTSGPMTIGKIGAGWRAASHSSSDDWHGWKWNPHQWNQDWKPARKDDMEEVTEEVVVAEADVTVPSATASAKKGFREGEGQSLCQRLQDLQGLHPRLPQRQSHLQGC